jgi:NitT/TauT family transport system permease protein
MVSTTAPRGPRSAAAKHSGLFFAVLGVAAILVGWQLVSLVVNPAIMASPALKRLVIGLAVGAAVGWVLGVFAGLGPRLRSFLEPLRWVGMTIPAVIIAVLAGLWFGLGDFTVIFMVAVIVTPTMYVNTLAGVLAIDPRLVEMGKVYRFSRRLLLTEVYLPGIGSPVMAGLTLATGIAVRAVVLAEVLGAMDGIGHSFARANSFLDTPELFAWIVVLLALMGILEFGVLRPLRRRVMRWRKAAE